MNTYKLIILAAMVLLLLSASGFAASGVDEYLLARFGVLKLYETDARQLSFPRVYDIDCHQVVAFTRKPQVALKSARYEIGHEKHDSTTGHDLVEIFQRVAYVCFDSLWLEIQQLPYHAKHMFLAFLWRHEFLDLVGEHYEADLIAIFYGREREQRTELGGDLVFQFVCCPEIPG